jgi:hypothetical protein
VLAASGSTARVVAVSGIAWDETQMCLSLKIDDRYTPAQTVSNWHVIISAASLVCFVVEADGRCTSSYVASARPPVASMNTKAECLHHGLFHIPHTRPFEKKIDSLDKHAYISIRAYNCDGASANWRLFAHMAQQQSRTLASMKLCTLHRMKHCETAVVGACGVKLVGALYSHSLLLKMGGYFLRLVHGLDVLVQTIRIHKGHPPPPEAKLFLSQFVDYMCHMHAITSRQDHASSHSQKKRNRNVGAENCKLRWTAVVKVLNGRWWTGELGDCFWISSVRIRTLLLLLAINHCYPHNGRRFTAISCRRKHSLGYCSSAA